MLSVIYDTTEFVLIIVVMLSIKNYSLYVVTDLNSTYLSIDIN